MRSPISWIVVLVTLGWASAALALSPKEVYQRAGPAVVLVLGSDDGRSGSAGTGSIITSEGKVITNAHVVMNKNKPYKTLYVFTKPPRISGDNRRDLANRYEARVLYFSPAEELDLALLQIENPPPNLPIIRFADPDKVDIGDDAIAIGHPEQGGLWTLTTGAVSSVIANFGRVKGKNVFQTEASVNKGNSGGPLLDADANMIGINTMIARQGSGGVAITDVNFALKSSVAVGWLSGQAGMGLAYAPKDKENLLVAVVPQATQVPAAAEPAKPAAATPLKKSQVVSEVPPATIVVAEAPPKKPAKIVNDGRAVGKKKAKEKLKGERLDPKKAKPTYHTEQRAISLDDIRRQQMQDLEDIMDDAKSKIRSKKSRGLGLW